MAIRKTTQRRNASSAGANELDGGIDYGLCELGELIRGFRLRVPKYQRNYAWDDEHVSLHFRRASSIAKRLEGEGEEALPKVQYFLK
jgi:hypothetical protein